MLCDNSFKNVWLGSIEQHHRKKQPTKIARWSCFWSWRTLKLIDFGTENVPLWALFTLKRTSKFIFHLIILPRLNCENPNKEIPNKNDIIPNIEITISEDDPITFPVGLDELLKIKRIPKKVKNTPNPPSSPLFFGIGLRPASYQSCLVTPKYLLESTRYCSAQLNSSFLISSALNLIFASLCSTSETLGEES